MVIVGSAFWWPTAAARRRCRNWRVDACPGADVLWHEISMLISCQSTSAPGQASTRQFRHRRRAAAVGHQKAEPTITIQPADHRKTRPTEDFYFGTFGHI